MPDYVYTSISSDGTATGLHGRFTLEAPFGSPEFVALFALRQRDFLTGKGDKLRYVNGDIAPSRTFIVWTAKHQDSDAHRGYYQPQSLAQGRVITLDADALDTADARVDKIHQLAVAREELDAAQAKVASLEADLAC